MIKNFKNIGDNMLNADEFRIVFVNTESHDNAKQISRILVTEKYAACCSVIQNVISFFSWQNFIQERSEFLIIIKTSLEKLSDLEKRIRELHTDEAPEIISLPLDFASDSYLNWMKQVLRDG